jgi:hypothetical protein
MHSATSRQGLVRVVAGARLAAYLAELDAISWGTHKDQVDSNSGAFNKLARVDLVISV